MQRADFALTAVQAPPPQVVLLEAFSNVSCVGCPQMSATVAALTAEPGFGPDRVLLVKYAANWPALNDPHYQANLATTARASRSTSPTSRWASRRSC